MPNMPRVCTSHVRPYINDILKQLLNLTRLFADDRDLFYAAARLEDIAVIIYHDLIMLPSWAKQW